MVPREWPEPPEQTADADTIHQGNKLYLTYCQFCHGAGGVSGGLIPDLRYSVMLESEEDWQNIVIGGMLEDAGMISFGDMMNAEEAESIRAYIIDRLVRDKAYAESQQATAE